MHNRGLKAILFGIQLVLIGGLLIYGLTPLITFYGAEFSQATGGTAAPFVYFGPLPGLIVVLIGGVIGSGSAARGAMRVRQDYAERVGSRGRWRVRGHC